MTKTLLALAAVAVAFGGTPAFAQTYVQDYRAYPTYRTQWPAGLEQQERSVTRQLNTEQASQPTQYYYPPQYSYVPPPQYSYAPPSQYSYAPSSQYSYAPPPAYGYSYDYPPRRWNPRY